MSSVCIIPARGGSKRIPRKNMREFCGKPIMAYSIMAALESELFDEVMVSTDDSEIARVAEHYGAKVPFMRTTASSGDFATTSDVMLEVLSEYSRIGRSFETLCCLYPTAVFVNAQKLQEAMSLLNSGCESVIVATRFSSPPQRGLVASCDSAAWWMPQYATRRSQDLEPIYQDVGQFYLAITSSYLEQKTFLTKKAKLYLVPDWEVQDIDNESDWRIAELKYRAMSSLA